MNSETLIVVLCALTVAINVWTVVRARQHHRRFRKQLQDLLR